MAWEQVEAPESVKSFLQNIIDSDRVAHAYLFTGMDLWKRPVAIQFAKALNCPNGTINSCDECPTCQQIENGNSPEVVEIYPDGSSIKIDQVRVVQRQFSYSPRPNTMRVLIFHQAELLTPQAANSLLKFLEEPISPMVAILFTVQEQAVLPTIRSRCQKIRFPSLSPTFLAQKWKEAGLEDWQAELYSRISGSELSSNQIMEKEAFAQLIEQVIEWNREILADRTEALLFLYQEPFTTLLQEGKAALLLDLLLLWQRELLYKICNSHKSNEKLFQPWRGELDRQVYLKDLPSFLNLMERVIEARYHLAKPMQAQAILEQMVLSMQEG